MAVYIAAIEGTFLEFVRGGECGRLFREFDWDSSDLGPHDDWPAELRTLVNVMLGSLQPMLIVWGPQQITLYNDGYALMCGNRHPRAFGRPFHELWFDIWEQVEPIIEAAYAGQGTSMDDIEFIMHRKGYPEETHFSFSYTPVRDPAGKILGMFCACAEITNEVLMRREQKRQQERLRQVFELSPGGTATLVGPSHVFEFANEEYRSIIGAERDIIGKPLAEAVSEIVAQGFVGLLDEVYRTGDPYIAKAKPVVLNRGPSGERHTRMIDMVFQPMRDAYGVISGILVQVQDVTERMAEEHHRELVAHELGHRLKNQLAMIQAIASQTLRSAPNLTVARQTLGERITILGRAHDTVIQGGLGSSTVRNLVAQMLAVHEDQREPRFRVEGPDIKVGSRPALSLSLILHELATNAVKYGALSCAQGKIEITWSVEGEALDRFEFVWREQGGPAVDPPTREGAGSRLIKAGVAGTADSKVTVHYDPAGLRCVVVAGLAALQRDS